MTADATSDTNTSQSGAGSSGGVASTVAGTAGGAAGTGTMVDQASARDRNAQSFAGSTVSEDIGSDERYSASNADARDLYQWNQKRTGDQAQSVDLDMLMETRLDRSRERERTAREDMARLSQERRHAETEFQQRLQNDRADAEQRRRHADDMHAVGVFNAFGFSASALEAFADNVAGKVCAKMKAG